MKHLDGIGNPMGEYAQVAKHLESPSVKMDMLTRYAQGMSPAVPQFLALAEIKRRQNLTEHAPAPSQTTVEEDLISKAMAPQGMAPQQQAGLPAMQRPQGVAALPSGMGEQSFAGGGIVAFSGEKDSLVEDEQARRDSEDLKYGWARTKAAARDILTLPGRGLAGAFESAVTRPVRAMGIDMPYLPRSFYGGDAASLTPHMDNLNRQAATAKSAGWDDGTANTGTRLPDNTYAPPLGSPPTGAGGAEGSNGPTKAQIDALNARPKSNDNPGAEGTPKEDMYAKYEEMLKGQAAETKEARQQDKYMRLLEAGLGIMGGTSQYAMANIGQGAMGAAKGYAQDKAGYRKEDRDNIKELMGLGMKKEEAIRENEKLAIMRKEAEDKGGYYGAYADYLKSGKGGGAGNGTKLQIAQDKNAVALYNKWLAGNPMASPEEQNAAWLRSQQMAGAQGPGAEPATNTVQWGSLGAKS